MDDKEKMQEFVDAYNEICEKFGFHIEASPKFVPTNHGSFEIGINVSIERNPQKNQIRQ